MVSTAEKLAKNLNLSDLKNATSLKKKLLFTLFVILIYRLGSFIPLPGVDASALQDLFASQSGGLLDIFNSFTGGALSRMTIFALNIIPYISASIIMQMMVFVVPSLQQLKKEGQSGQEKINQYTRYLTILICVVQGYGMAMGLLQMPGAVVTPGGAFVFTTILTLLAGSMLVMWMGEQITAKGIGQGSSLIICVGIISVLPSTLIKTIELIRIDQISPIQTLVLLGLLFALFYCVVAVEIAQRRISVHYPKKAGMMMGGQNSTHLPLKLNLAGVLPPIFASSLIGVPALITSFMAGKGGGSGFLQMLNSYLQHGSIVYMLMFAGLIGLFSFLFASMYFNPEETAENLKESGAFIPGIRPGDATAKYLDYVVTRLTVFGAAYLIIVCLLPDYIASTIGVQFLLGGTSLLIVCNVVMDLISQIHSNLISSQYESIMKNQPKQRRRFR